MGRFHSRPQGSSARSYDPAASAALIKGVKANASRVPDIRQVRIKQVDGAKAHLQFAVPTEFERVGVAAIECEVRIELLLEPQGWLRVVLVVLWPRERVDGPPSSEFIEQRFISSQQKRAA